MLLDSCLGLISITVFTVNQLLTITMYKAIYTDEIFLTYSVSLTEDCLLYGQ